MMCKLKGGWIKDGWMNGVLGHFYALSRLNWAGTTWANEMNLGWMDKGGHYDVEIKGWMQNGAL